jgi:hypothetical protein
MSVQWLAKVKTPHATVFLMPGWRWVPAKGGGEVARAVAAMASSAGLHYTYSPADGFPGAKLARMVAEMLGGVASFPPRGPSIPGAVY